MNTLRICDLIESQYAMAKEDGSYVYSEIMNLIANEGSINLDFDGIARATSLFFNESLCKIAGEYGLEKYLDYITISGMTDTIKVIYLRALNLTLRKLENPDIYINAVKEGIKAYDEN